MVNWFAVSSEILLPESPPVRLTSAQLEGPDCRLPHDRLRRFFTIKGLCIATLPIGVASVSSMKQELGPNFNTLDLVCCRFDGRPFSTNALQHQFQTVLIDNGLPTIRFHDLRHTNATLMLRSAVPAKIVSSMLGHSNISVTLDTYSHVITEMQAPAIAAMNSILQVAG